MAPGTGYLRMFTVKFEGSSVVVKFHLFPFLDAMTTPAIGRAILFKLSAVYVFMASGTLGSNRCKNNFGLCGFIRLVTRTARYPVMCPLQFETGHTVVKSGGRPAFSDVALAAVLFRVIFCLKRVFMDVFMTVHTALTNISELPFRLFGLVKVTRKAGRGDVRAREREIRLPVLRHTE